MLMWQGVVVGKKSRIQIGGPYVLALGVVSYEGLNASSSSSLLLCSFPRLTIGGFYCVCIARWLVHLVVQGLIGCDVARQVILPTALCLRSYDL